MTEWCFGGWKPLLAMSPVSELSLDQSDDERGGRTSEREETPRRLGGLDQSLADPFTLIRLDQLG
jgi:hypothetical protein